MKQLVLLLLSASLAWGQAKTNLIATFDYPISGLSTTVTFHWFSTTNLSVPRSNWQHVAQEQCVIGKTNYSLSVTSTANCLWIYAAASNLTDFVPFPGAAEVPLTLRSDVSVVAKLPPF